MIAIIILAVLACILIGSGAYFTGMSRGYDEGFRAGWNSADDFWTDKNVERIGEDESEGILSADSDD